MVLECNLRFFILHFHVDFKPTISGNIFFVVIPKVVDIMVSFGEFLNLNV